MAKNECGLVAIGGEAPLGYSATNGKFNQRRVACGTRIALVF